ncbi:hypothetical protein PQQ52_20215 [Paraburkholderia sediminicola]|uniref:hypothetical protein n=1 Tax=Paraburkholderia sediminicola TaxID=458836 RepID=UPI0038BA93CE
MDLFSACPKRQAFLFAGSIREAPSPRHLPHVNHALTHAAAQPASKPMPRTAQRMPPVDPMPFRRHGIHLVQMPVFLPQFVGEKKRDDKQRDNQKGA